MSLHPQPAPDLPLDPPTLFMTRARRTIQVNHVFGKRWRHDVYKTRSSVNVDVEFDVFRNDLRQRVEDLFKYLLGSAVVTVYRGSTSGQFVLVLEGERRNYALFTEPELGVHLRLSHTNTCHIRVVSGMNP